MTRLPNSHSLQLDRSTVRSQSTEATLEQHQIAELFTKHLGWESLDKDNVTLTTLLEAQRECTPIARKGNTEVWKVQLAAKTLLTSSIKEQLYREISGLKRTEPAVLKTQNSSPLVIFENETKCCSLWCQARGHQKRIESFLYVSGQPWLLWAFRLEQMRKTGRGLLRLQNNGECSSFKALIEQLCEGIRNIVNITDRRNYAVLTLQRLILIQSIQQKSWINGDTWYLQNRFEANLQSQENFFSSCIQPLYQCLSLPQVERPTALNTQVGNVPFLGHLFYTHQLEQKYNDVGIENSAFEQILGWLSEQTSADKCNLWTSGELSLCLEHALGQHSPEDVAQDDSQTNDWSIAQIARDRALNQLILNRTRSLGSKDFTSVNDLLFNADAKTCRYLIQNVLSNLSILDPACGSGNLLIEIYQNLVEIFCNIIGKSQHQQDAQLQIWISGLAEEARLGTDSSSSTNLLQAIQKRILKNNLYGVDIALPAVEATTFQLLLHTIATAQSPQDIEPLVDLDFNILRGNSLIGLIDVDKERFESVQKAKDNSFMQGNLLQPLIADSYQTILAEKNLAIEHYKFRNRTLAQARNIPEYARAALLKEDILRLDIKAQSKLDELLLNQMSQQLGIQYKAAQLDRKPQRRSLTIEDIDILQPFHWGYHFNLILERGGFDIIVCAPPQGPFKPTSTEFLQKFQDLAEVKGVNARSLKTSKQSLAKGDPEVAEAWLFYQNQYVYVADYFYRSEQYKHQNLKVNGKLTRNQLSRERLFVEQCFNLLSNKGICAIALSESLSQQPKAQTLYNFLQAEASVVEQDFKTSPQQQTITAFQRIN